MPPTVAPIPLLKCLASSPTSWDTSSLRVPLLTRHRTHFRLVLMSLVSCFNASIRQLHCWLWDSVKYADLAVIDLSRASTAEGRVLLSGEVARALHEKGFFYVVNHGYTQDQVRTSIFLSRSDIHILQTNRIFSIANILFDGVDVEEKIKYQGESPSVYEGYKPKNTWVCLSFIVWDFWRSIFCSF